MKKKLERVEKVIDWSERDFEKAFICSLWKTSANER